jgi:hypothetical protein
MREACVLGKGFVTGCDSYTIFVNALEAGIDKLQKYYNRFDLKLAILINLGKLFRDDPYQLI